MHILTIGINAVMDEIHEFESYDCCDDYNGNTDKICIDSVPIGDIGTVGDIRRIGIEKFVQQVDYLIDSHKVIGNFYDNKGKIIPDEMMVRIWEGVFEYCNDDDEIEWYFVNI
ncbi:MAG: hypothetical protein EOM83_15715 [Clostridia bacterium]|nr:hypothetical protein [Clostridia bacterium]